MGQTRAPTGQPPLFTLGELGRAPLTRADVMRADEVAMNNAVQTLQAAGARLPHPHSSAVQGEAGAGFRELRPRAGRSRWRPVYRQATPDTFVIVAVAPEAQIDQRGFNAAVDRAVSRFANLDLS